RHPQPCSRGVPLGEQGLDPRRRAVGDAEGLQSGAGRRRSRGDGVLSGSSHQVAVAFAAPSRSARFFLKSSMAALIRAAARTEQGIFTGGSESSLAISLLVISVAWSTVLPLTHSVTSELLAMAEPQPKVLNFASWMTPSSEIRSCRRITSPQA